jgi:hypothetical protein
VLTLETEREKTIAANANALVLLMIFPMEQLSYLESRRPDPELPDRRIGENEHARQRDASTWRATA